MSTDTHRHTGVSLWRHPMAVLVAALIGIAGVAASRGDVHSARELHVSLLVGFAVGLPTILIEKWVLRKYRDFSAELFTTPFAERPAWGKKNLLCSLPILMGVCANIVISSCFRLSLQLGLDVMCILCILLYPEQKAIWLAAKARVAEMENESHREGVS